MDILWFILIGNVVKTVILNVTLYLITGKLFDGLVKLGVCLMFELLGIAGSIKVNE